MSNNSNVRLEAGWKNVLKDQFEQPYFQAIKQFLVKEKAAGKKIYPPGSLIFNAFELTPWDQLKVVILGRLWDFASLFQGPCGGHLAYSIFIKK